MNIFIVILSYLLFFNTSIAEEINENTGTLITFIETLETEVAPDKISSSLTFIVEDKDVGEAQKKLNNKMQQAVRVANEIKNIKVSTDNYRVTEKFSMQKIQEFGKTIRKRVSDGWQATQSIKLKSSEVKDVMDLTLKLQKLGMKSNSINYFMSDNLIKNTEKGLMSGIISTIKDKVKNIQKDLGAKSYLISKIEFNKPNDIIHHKAMLATRSFDGSAMESAPLAIAEEQKIKVTAHVTVNFEK